MESVPGGVVLASTRSFSARFDSTAPVVAERAIYFGGNGSWIGGHASMGIPTLSVAGAPPLPTRYYFAEGVAAPGYDTYYLLVHPHPWAIEVTARYLLQVDNSVATTTFVVPANSRHTVHLNNPALNGVGNVGSVAAEFSSADGFAPEQSLY